MSSTVLILPGIGNSGPGHWQSRWQNAHPGFERVQQRDWEAPVCSEWVSALEAAVARTGADTVLVAHSLGCLLVAHWAQASRQKVRGALLVAVPDPAAAAFPAVAVGFAPVPQRPLGFASIVVASSDDPYGSLPHAETCAAAWGGTFVAIGDRGHINADSGLGDWPEGWHLLSRLRGA